MLPFFTSTLYVALATNARNVENTNYHLSEFEPHRLSTRVTVCIRRTSASWCLVKCRHCCRCVTLTWASALNVHLPLRWHQWLISCCSWLLSHVVVMTMRVASTPCALYLVKLMTVTSLSVKDHSNCSIGHRRPTLANFGRRCVYCTSYSLPLSL